MKLKRLIALPFAFVADAATLGNIGGNRSFTQQVFDADRRDQANEAETALARALLEALRQRPRGGE